MLLEVMNTKHPMKVDNTEVVTEQILDYINKNKYFYLSDLVYSIDFDEPYRVRELAHIILDPMVAKNKLKLMWDQGYYYVKVTK